MHYYYRRHVTKPIKSCVSRIRPQTDETETDLHRATDGVDTFHRSLLNTKLSTIRDKSTKKIGFNANKAHVHIFQYVLHVS